LSDLNELPEYRQENPDFGLNGGDLSPILTPTSKKKYKQIAAAQ
jgi:hypothetical protein